MKNSGSKRTEPKNSEISRVLAKVNQGGERLFGKMWVENIILIVLELTQLILLLYLLYKLSSTTSQLRELLQ